MPRLIHSLLQQGQTVLVQGQRNAYQVLNAFKEHVFKARRTDSSTPVIIKTEGTPIVYERELDVYQFSCIRQSRYIRSFLESIDNDTDKCMIFEWMDHDLWSLRHERRHRSSDFTKVVAKSILKALTVFSDMDGQGPGVHTDVNPNNILVSAVDTPSPVVKLADLVVPTGESEDYRLQGLAIRAPEIWMGRPLSPACDVWSVGASLAHFLATKILFGPAGLNIRIPSKSQETTEAAWCIGNIIQLIGPLEWDRTSRYAEEFEIAELLVKKRLIKSRPLEEELAGVPRACVDFIRYLMRLNPDERPSAQQALEHPWLRCASPHIEVCPHAENSLHLNDP